MSKELTPLENWKEVKDYLYYCLYDFVEDCNALCYTSTSQYLQPHIDNVEKALKALEIIKKHKLLNYVLKNKKCASMYHLSEEECDFLRSF